MDIKENFYQKLRMIREANFSPAFYPKSGGSRDVRGSGVETQPSGAQVTTPSKIKPTTSSGNTTVVDKAKGAVKSNVIQPMRKAMGFGPYGHSSNKPVVNRDNPKLDFGSKK